MEEETKFIAVKNGFMKLGCEWTNRQKDAKTEWQTDWKKIQTQYQTERKTDVEKTHRQTKAQKVCLKENIDTGTEIEVEGTLKQ